MRRLIISVIALLLLPLALYSRNIRIKGLVLDESGNAAIGAAVMVLGTDKGTVVDAAGKFSIEADSYATLVVSCLGYVEQRIPVEARQDIKVILVPDNKVLDETVVIGYGTAKKKDLTGAVTVVEMDKLQSAALMNVDEALAGRIAGVEVISSGGQPGESSNIRIRGSRSINAGNEPLIVVDGVMDAVSDLGDLSPDIIKSVTVLKDASSTAIYGSRGANGVILVTTKGDTGSAFHVSLTASAALSHLPRKLDVLNASEFATYRNMARRIAYPNQEPPFPDPSALGEGTDWQQALTRLAPTQKYQLNIFRGNSNSHFFMSGGYDGISGIIIGTDARRYNFNFKADIKPFKWMKIGANANFAFRHADKSNIKMAGASYGTAATLSPLCGLEDTWTRYADAANGGAAFNSPWIAARSVTNYTNITHFNVIPWVEFLPVAGLSIKTLFSWRMTNNDSFVYSPSTLAVAAVNKTGGTATRDLQKTDMLLSETTVSWKKTFNSLHSLSLTGGFTSQRTDVSRRYTKGVGYLDDSVGAENMSALLDKRNLTEDTSRSSIQRLSVLGRAMYTLMGRYHFTATARADASSNFAEGHKWAFFPAFAFKWSLINEPWMLNVKASALNELAIRLSAGRSGNDSIPAYASQSVLDSGNSTWLFGDNQQLAYWPLRLENPSLTWEKTDQYNIGVDIGILNNRISVTADAYLSRTTDLLLLMQNASHTGFTTRMTNMGSTAGWGAELSITSHNISLRNFDWQTTLTLSHSTSVVTDLGVDYEYVPTFTIDGQMAFGYMKGYPVNALWGFQSCGVWHNSTERENNKYTRAYVSVQDADGYEKFADRNHDGIMNREDLVYLGSTDPVIQGGFNNTFKIGKFDLGLYFTFSAGGKIYNIAEVYLGSSQTNSNKYRYMLDGWTPENPDSDLPSAYSPGSVTNSRFVHDSSFLRLKTLSLGYTFDFAGKVKWLRSLSLNLYGENLWLLASYNGYDPEVSSSKTIARIDNSAYPLPRTYMFSLKLRY